MKRLIVYLAIAVLSGLASFVLPPNSIGFTLISAAAIGFAVPVVDACIRHFELLRFAWMAVRSWRDDVRVSVSYLIAVKVEDKYLLVKSRRFDHFQPVGGVFKVYPSGKAFLATLNALDDDLYRMDATGKHDLRIRIKGRHLVRFFEWFYTRRGRETDVWREFREELITPGILDADIFKYVRAEFSGTRDTGLRWSDFVQSKEIILAEIYRLVPTDAQQESLMSLMGVENDDLYWATESEIRRRGARENEGVSATISDHSSWIL